MRQRKCFNCKFKGPSFRLGKITHMHCENPEYNKELKIGGELSPWETLREFWQTCERHEFNNQKGDEDGKEGIE